MLVGKIPSPVISVESVIIVESVESVISVIGVERLILSWTKYSWVKPHEYHKLAALH